MWKFVEVDEFDKEELYKWHDLEANPEDTIDKKSAKVFICLAEKHTSIYDPVYCACTYHRTRYGGERFELMGLENSIWDFFDEDVWEIVAWKYVDLFNDDE